MTALHVIAALTGPLAAVVLIALAEAADRADRQRGTKISEARDAARLKALLARDTPPGRSA